MIEINLLPKELRKKEKLDLSGTPVLLIAGGILIALFMLSFVLAGMTHHYQARFKRLTRELQSKAPSRSEALKLQTEIERLRAKKEIIEQLAERRFFWAEKLSLISDSIPMGVWLTGLSFNEVGEGEFLTLDGVAIPYRGQEMINLVTLFMGNLKQNDDFYKDFKNIELGPIRRIKSDEIEAVQFNLTCQFKEE